MTPIKTAVNSVASALAVVKAERSIGCDITHGFWARTLRHTGQMDVYDVCMKVGLGGLASSATAFVAFFVLWIRRKALRPQWVLALAVLLVLSLGSYLVGMKPVRRVISEFSTGGGEDSAS